MQLMKPTYTTNGKTRHSGRWHVRFRDHLNIRQRVPAFTDKGVSRKLGEKLELLAARLKAGEPLGELTPWIDGLPDDLRDSLIEWGMLRRETRISELVDDYHAAQLDKDKTERVADQNRAMVLKVFGGCGFVFWRDIDAEKVEGWLAEQRRGDNGAKAIKKRTSNHWLSACKAFCTYCVVKRDAAPFSPLRAADKVPVTDEKSYGGFTEPQVHELVTYCENATDVWGVRQKKPLVRNRKKRGRRCDLSKYLDGPGRALVYALAAETLLRAGAIRSLTVGQVTIHRNTNGTVSGGVIRTTVGQQRKSKTAHDVTIRASLAGRLDRQIAGKAPAMKVVDLPVFVAEMLRQDLFNAGLPMVDEAGLPLVYHSFRVGGATWVGDKTGSDKTVQSLTGHKTRQMAAHYNRRTQREQQVALDPEQA